MMMPATPPPELPPEGLTAKAEFSQWIEIRKLLNDYFKHLATLDTASVGLIIAFMDKFSAQPKDRGFAIAALAFFIISLLGIAISQLYIIADSTLALKLSRGRALPIRFTMDSRFGEIAMDVAAIGFVAGVIALAAFALTNLIS